MKRVIGGSCVAAVLSFGMAAFAQTTGQGPTGSSGQAGTQSMTQGRQVGDRTQTLQQITLVGCVQREGDYRQAAGSGRGGALGSGVGVGNEFVLANASTAPASGSETAVTGTAGTAGAATGTTAGATTGATAGTGTAGTTGSTAGTAGTSSPATSMTSGGIAYALTGDGEKDLEQLVGQRVEIVGTLEPDSARSGSSSGATAGTSPTPGTSAGTPAGTAPTGTAPTGTAPAAGSTGMTQRFGNLQEVTIVSFRPVGGSCTP